VGRKRTISQDRIFDAVRAVVARDGAARLTLDAVAAEAGISKASVLYDYKTKSALIEWVLRRAIAMEAEMNEAAMTALGAKPDAFMQGRLSMASEPPTQDHRATALALHAALAQDEQLRSIVQDYQATLVGQVIRTSSEPRGAVLAYLALQGLRILETLELHTFPEGERNVLIREIGWLVDWPPAPKASAE
jgi:AcrR family transcriptional regulator